MGICIKGAVGNSAGRVNGYYDLVPDKPHNFRPQYRKVDDPDAWLVMTPDGKWYVSSTETKKSNANGGWCRSTDHHTLTPDLATGWEMAVNGTFVKQSEVHVVGFSASEWAVEQVSLGDDVCDQINRSVCGEDGRCQPSHVCWICDWCCVQDSFKKRRQEETFKAMAMAKSKVGGDIDDRTCNSSCHIMSEIFFQ